jgi:primosomal protein N'
MLVADVIVDRPVWRLDRPLTYLIPDEMRARVRLGSVVRVPLRERRVRGWVVGVRNESPDPAVLSIAGVSGPAAVFDETLLRVASAMARRYVHPLSYFLRVMTPPRLGRAATAGSVSQEERPPALPDLAQSAAGAADRPGANYWRLAPGEDAVEGYADVISEVLERGKGAIVSVPEVTQGSLVLSRLESMFSSQSAVAHSGMDPAVRSDALWAAAVGDKKLVLGGRAVVFAPMFDLGALVIHAEHDRSFKEQRAPYYDARIVALARAEASGATLLMASQTPSLSGLARTGNGWVLREPPRDRERSLWPVVEIVDPAPSGIPRRAVAAIIEARRRAERTLVLLSRARASRAGPGPHEVATFLSRVVPEARIARADRPALQAGSGLAAALEAEVIVATEAALVEIERPRISVAIALDVDLLFQRPGGRQVEDAFVTLWSLAAMLRGGRKAEAGPGRVILVTGSPGHHAVQAIVRGDYHYFARRELDNRRATNSPPCSTLIRFWGEGVGADLTQELKELTDAEMLGPAPAKRGAELLLKVADLEAILDPLRRIVSSRQETIHVEVEPRDW